LRKGASLDQLVLEHLPAALRFATRLTGDPHRGEELVQEALLRVVRRFATFRGDAGFRTWLFRILINVFRDRLGASQIDHVSLAENREELIDPAIAGPPEAAMAAELTGIVARQISRLPPRQREVLVLIVFEGLSSTEVAEVVGISEANVYSNLSAARARLKARLAPYFGSVEKKSAEN
jgi:RNA polymerase sigma-70 factor (ECF subfamily)